MTVLPKQEKTISLEIITLRRIAEVFLNKIKAEEEVVVTGTVVHGRDNNSCGKAVLIFEVSGKLFYEYKKRMDRKRLHPLGSWLDEHNEKCPHCGSSFERDKSYERQSEIYSLFDCQDELIFPNITSEINSIYPLESIDLVVLPVGWCDERSETRGELETMVTRVGVSNWRDDIHRIPNILDKYQEGLEILGSRDSFGNIVMANTKGS